MIELNNIRKTYRTSKGMKTKALDDISIKFETSGLTFILGTSGSGKSTLLNLIGGLDRCDEGEIKFLNKNINELSLKELCSYRNKYIGFIFQEFNLLEEYNVYDNIVLPLRFQKKYINIKKINKILEILRIDDLKLRKINELSGGQKQRIAIARALVKDPMIILADEPTGNLDDENGIQVMDLLKYISQNKLVIVVSHNKSMALKYADRILKIEKGRIIDDIIINNHTQKYKNMKILEMKKTKLPFIDGMKLGIQFILTKKLKFIFTLILVVISLLLFGIARSISTFDYSKSYAELLFDNNEYYYFLKKGNQEERVNYINDTEMENIVKDFKNYNVIKVNTDEYDEKLTFKSIGIDFSNIDDVSAPLYYTSSSISELNLTIIDDKSLALDIQGKLPSNSHEVAISNYIADHIIKYGISLNNEKKEFSNYVDILNGMVTIPIMGQNMKIVGIINNDLSKYQYYKDKTYKDLTDDERKSFEHINQTLIYKKEYLYNNIYVTKDFINLYGSKKAEGIINLNDKIISTNFEPLQNKIDIYDGIIKKELNSLKDNEIVVDINNFLDLPFNNMFINYINDNYKDKNIDIEKEKLLFINKILKENDIIGKEINIDIYEKNSDEVIKSLEKMKIVGIYVSTSDNDHNYLQAKLIDDYLISPLQTSKVLLKFASKEEATKIISKYSFVNAKENDIIVKTPYSYNMENSIDSLFLVKNITQILSIILLIFSILLIFNFISSSIIQKEKTIGTLSGIGASTNDVIKIFIWEGLILSFLAIIFSTILLIPLINLLNIIFYSNLRFELNFIYFNYKQVIELSFLMFVITTLSCIIPIQKIAKMKPIDAINKK